MPLGAPAAAPAGWLQFCAKDRLECERGSPRFDVRMASATDTLDQGSVGQAPTAATGDEAFADQGQPGAFAWIAQANTVRFEMSNDLTPAGFQTYPAWGASPDVDDGTGLERIEPGVFASLETPYLQPAGGRQATLTADMADDFGTASVPVSGDRRLSWANREAPNLHVQFASTYSLTLTPAEPVSTLSLSSGSWMTRRVGIDAAMGRLQAYRAAGQVTASGSMQLASGPLVLTQDLWNEVRTVNDRINRAILKRSDRELYGVDENWTLPLEAGVNAGDCEDFVLEKRRALLEAGVPQSALSIAVVTTYRGVSHAVLLISTDRGDYVLDSLTPWILPWAKTDYHWDERQVAGSTEHWASLSAPQIVKRTADGKAAVLLISL